MAFQPIYKENAKEPKPNQIESLGKPYTGHPHWTLLSLLSTLHLSVSSLFPLGTMMEFLICANSKYTNTNFKSQLSPNNFSGP